MHLLSEGNEDNCNSIRRDPNIQLKLSTNYLPLAFNQTIRTHEASIKLSNISDRFMRKN
ncbi:MAG: hypothetical protein SGI96_16680 [Bacteroidota bacterium]|nr:hypothetical protein [Bacteroidota bacterium]